MYMYGWMALFVDRTPVVPIPPLVQSYLQLIPGSMSAQNTCRQQVGQEACGGFGTASTILTRTERMQELIDHFGMSLWFTFRWAQESSTQDAAARRTLWTFES